VHQQLFEIFFLPRESIEGFALGIQNFRDMVIETGTVTRKFLSWSLAKSSVRIVSGLARHAIDAGVEVPLRTSQFDLIVVEAAQTVVIEGTPLPSMEYRKR